MKLKSIISYILLLFVVLLVVLPFATTMNEGLTRIVERMFWYGWLEKYVVPYESRMLAGLLSYIPGINPMVTPKGVEVMGMHIYVTWNCLGWQSFLLLLLSLSVGFRGKFTKMSKFWSLVFGMCGLFVVNVFRLVFTALLAVYVPRIFTLVFHNYFLTMLTIGWLLFFWWFSYAYVLEERDEGVTANV